VMQSGTVAGQVTSEDQFLDLICSDEELVRAEFDAIVAAGWPGASADPPRDDVPRADRPLSAARSTRSARRSKRLRPTGRAQFASVNAWARQRSPPGDEPACPDRVRGSRPRRRAGPSRVVGR
jgi:hypothetical protein